MDPVASVKPESCATCHGEVGEKLHQATYDKYVDASNLKLTFDSVVSTGTAPNITVQLNFRITKNGLPYTDADKLPSMLQRTFYAVRYDSATRRFIDSKSMSYNGVVSNGGGAYTLTATGFSYAPELSNAEVYGYIAQDLLDVESDSSVKPSTHYHLYDNMASASLAFGDVGTYVSAANVAGCEKCHGTPYRKHGYREAKVAGIPDFASCKTCHYDTRNGGHTDWQYMVDDPLNWALGGAPTADYSYTANVMNDVHMSHAMEFPYPMSMANCATCHAGKLNQILTDANFTATTCKSCHPIQAQAAYPTEKGRAPAMMKVWADAGVGFHNIGMDCKACHSAAAGYVGRAFNALHTGYNKMIYNASGVKYSTLYSATITSVSLTGNVLDIKFTANNPAITKPQVTVSFYGWNSKQFVISSHTSGANGLRMEKTIGTANALFTEVASGPTNFEVKLDMAAYVPATGTTDTIPAMITAGKIKKAEILVMPTLVIGGTTVALDSPSVTFDLGTKAIVPNYFKGTNATVSEAKCNNCHDALATTFHAADRGGNIVACRTCHVTTSGAFHLEMQSRGIDSYVHAIHDFQGLDTHTPVVTSHGPSGTDFTDPVAKARYALHIEHTFPNFTLKNCEGCHVDGTFNVPDQSKSMPGLLSGSVTWNVPRNMGTVPAYVTGPAARACGGCHRAEFIKEDLPSELAAFNQHTNVGGYLVENDTANTYVWKIIDKMMTWFK